MTGRGPNGQGFPVKTFEWEGYDISAQTGETKERAVPQLRRRLGRADLRAVPEARRALRELLRHWGGPGRSEVAELLTSELVTNALVHTDEGAVLTATVGPRALRVEVRDFTGRLPAPAPRTRRGPTAEGWSWCARSPTTGAYGPTRGQVGLVRARGGPGAGGGSGSGLRHRGCRCLRPRSVR